MSDLDAWADAEARMQQHVHDGTLDDAVHSPRNEAAVDQELALIREIAGLASASQIAFMRGDDEAGIALQGSMGRRLASLDRLDLISLAGSLALALGEVTGGAR